MEDSIFEEIYRETAGPLWAYISRISGNATAADDILQETYLSFLRSSFEKSDLKEAKPYLYKIGSRLPTPGKKLSSISAISWEVVRQLNRKR